MRTVTPAIERLLERKVVDEDGCWVLPDRGTNNSGYCSIYADGRSDGAHRVSYRFFVGPIPKGYTIEHKCHTEDPSCPGGVCKHRRCWNPEHLTVLTQGDNNKVSRAPSMETWRTGICERGHKVSGANACEWRSPTGRVQRQCRKCHEDRARERVAGRPPRTYTRRPQQPGRAA